MWTAGADEQAALVFEDLASALDAGIPLATLGGDPAAGERVLHGIASARGVRLTETEDEVLVHAWSSGGAPAALRARAEQRRARAAFLRAVLGALAYPALLLATVFASSVLLSSLLGPGIAIGIAVAIGLLAIVVSATFVLVRRGVLRIERWPLAGWLVADLREIPYLETLHALYGAGVPIVTAHSRAVRTVTMPDLHQRLAAAAPLLAAGQPLRDALVGAGALAAETRQLLAIGEQSGDLEAALGRAATRRREVATRKLTRAARNLGRFAYVAAAVAVVAYVFHFYTTYFGLIVR